MEKNIEHKMETEVVRNGSGGILEGVVGMDTGDIY